MITLEINEHCQSPVSHESFVFRCGGSGGPDLWGIRMCCGWSDQQWLCAGNITHVHVCASHRPPNPLWHILFMFCHGCFCCFSCWMKVKADLERRLWLKFKWRLGLIYMFSFRSSAQYNHHSRELCSQQWWRWQCASCPEDFSSFLTQQQCFQVLHQDLPTLDLQVPQMKLCPTMWD